MSDFVDLAGVTKTYAGITALDDVSFAIGAGEAVCLAGENGSGKSTLIKILAGVEQPDRARIAFNGVVQGALTPRAAADAGVMVIFQDFSLFPNLTVAENIALPSALGAHRRFASVAHNRALAAATMERVGVSLDPGARVEALAVAQKQLVAICRALARGRAAHHHGRAHHRADRARGARAPRHHPQAEGGRRRGALRLPQARRGARGLREGRGAAQRRQGDRGAGVGVRRRIPHPPHDRARPGRGAGGRRSTPRPRC